MLKNKSVLNNIAIFCILVTIYFVLSMIANSYFEFPRIQMWKIEGDPFWNYCAISKLSSGLLPYRDINIIVNPLFFFIGTFFINSFGNNFIAYSIYNGFIYGTTFFLIYQILKKLDIDKKIYIPSILFGMLISVICFCTSYNHLALVFILAILYIEICKNKKETSFINNHPIFFEILTGLLLILCFLTKQNLGIYYGIAYFIYWFIINKNNPLKTTFKCLLYKCLGALIGLVPFLIYLTVFKLWPDYLDLCFLGLGDFNANCKLIDWPTIPYIVLFIIEIVIHIKNYFKDKKPSSLLIIAFSLASLGALYPILDINHMMTIFPFIIITFATSDTIVKKFYLSHFKVSSIILKIIFITIVTILLVVYCFPVVYTPTPDKYSIFKGALLLDNYFYKKLDDVNDYLSEKQDQGYTIFFLSPDAVIYRWPLRYKRK